MTFYVEKRLPFGAISFGVTPAGESVSPDHGGLSTGPAGEFISRRNAGFFFGGNDRFSEPAVPPPPSITRTPFWTSFRSDSPARTWTFFTLMGVVILLALLGFAVIARKGPQGWVEVVLGFALIATPILLTAQRRRSIREQEERQRAEREEAERKKRELLASYTAVLEHARNEPTPPAFARLAQNREALTLPYEIWGPVARRTVLLIGFDELARRGPGAAKDILELIDRAAEAAGLPPGERTRVRGDLVRTVIWHLLADHRLGKAAALRNGLSPDPDDARAVEQFRRLQGLTVESLPRIHCNTKLEFREHCIYETATDRGTLHVTNKRVIVEGKKRVEMPVAHAFDVVVNADEQTILIKTGDPAKPLRLRLDEPIYAAGILDLASTIDERPKGFA